jgi:N-formylglutamate deformylase
VIIDLHSFPREELPYERLIHADFPRPECCIGTDPAHTPPSLVTAVEKAFAPIGECRLNEPFAGTYVPLPFYQTDERVSSVMVELRRDTYLSTNDGVPRLGRMLASLIDMIDLGN